MELRIEKNIVVVQEQVTEQVYVLKLSAKELEHLYVLSHMHEGGNQFPATGRWTQVCRELNPKLAELRDLNTRSYPPLRVT